MTVWFFFHAPLSVAVIKHSFCYGEAIPLLGPWEFRLVTPVQDNEHTAVHQAPPPKSRAEQAQSLSFNYVMIYESECFTL